MNLDDLNNLKNQIQIPADLDVLVAEQLAPKKSARTGLKLAAAAMIGTVGLLNALPAVATELRTLPLAQPVVDFVTFNRFDFSASSPDLRDYGTIGIELTEQYAAQAAELYAEYSATTKNPAEFRKAVESSYQILWQSDEYLVVQHTLLEIMASGYEQVTYDVVDLVDEQVIELQAIVDLDAASTELSNLIYQDLVRQEAAGTPIFLDEISADSILNRTSDFYINDSFELVFVFDEYEIAAGSAGVVEVEITASEIQNYVLRSDLVH